MTAEESDTDEGQATIEFALVLPLALATVFLLVQTAVVIVCHLDLYHDARLAIRAAAVAGDPESAARQAVRRIDSPDAVDIAVRTTDRLVTVGLRRSVPIVVPILSGLVPDLTVSATLTMALEPPVHIEDPETLG